jgi:hypothetical protein
VHEKPESEGLGNLEIFSGASTPLILPILAGPDQMIGVFIA